MIIKRLIIMGFCSILLACSGIESIVIPGTYSTLGSFWIKKIVRRVKFVPNINNIVEENLININNRISTSSRFSFTRAPRSIYYYHYHEPFGFHIFVNNINKETDKIIIKQCYILMANNEIINLLEIPDINRSYSFNWWLNDNSRKRGGGIRVFNDQMLINLERNEREFMDDINISFTNLPINYEFNNFVIIYEIELFINGNTKNIVKEIQFIRRIEEMSNVEDRNRLYNYEEDWLEINLEEWKRYL